MINWWVRLFKSGGASMQARCLATHSGFRVSGDKLSICWPIRHGNVNDAITLARDDGDGHTYAAYGDLGDDQLNVNGVQE